MSKLITVDVRVSQLLDRVVITPERVEDNMDLFNILQQALPETRVHTSAEGYWLGAHDAPALLEVGAGFDLRWGAEAFRFVENRQRVKITHQRIAQEIKAIQRGGQQLAEDYLADVTGLEPLDGHQWVDVAAMTLPDGYGLCVFDEQGAGKTVTLIFAFDVLVARDLVDAVLIVAPKSMLGEWPQDFQRFTNGLYKVEVIAGTLQQKRAALASGADVIVTNFETAVSMEQELTGMLRRYQGRVMLAVDESFHIKNLDAKRTRSLRRLREWCDRAFVLCGTPAPNAPHDIIQQFNIVDFGLTFGGIDVPEDRDAAHAVVQQAIDERGVYVRHLKADVIPNLPVKSFNRVLVTLQGEQLRLYVGALKGLILNLRSVDEKTFRRKLGSFIAKRSALLQICSNPTSVAEGYNEVPAKLSALDDLLEELIAKKGEKVVLWSFYTASLDAIYNRFEQFHPVRYDGSVDDVAERREAVRRFQDDDTTMLFVANPAAAGAGLTLHRARFAIYESMSNQAAHYLQSLDRIHRRGQARDVEYFVLLCDKTIELVEYERLTDKEHAAQLLLGDQADPPFTRESMLDEAINMIRLIEEK